MSKLAAIGITSLIAGVFGAKAAFVNLTADEVEFSVRDKERIVETSTDGDGNTSVKSKYLIFTDKGTYQNTDELFRLKFNSSDLYGKLEKDNSYKCDVYGWRVPILSWYKNLVDCEEITAQDAPEASQG